MNEELANKVLKQIETHPETWNQSVWRCETGMCFAGWIVELLPEYQWQENIPDADGYLLPHVIPPITFPLAYEGQETVSPRAVGVHELEITPEQATYLFTGKNTLDDIKTILELIRNGTEDDLFEFGHEQDRRG